MELFREIVYIVLIALTSVYMSEVHSCLVTPWVFVAVPLFTSFDQSIGAHVVVVLFIQTIVLVGVAEWKLYDNTSHLYMQLLFLTIIAA